MKIGILSDIHDHIDNLKKSKLIFDKEKVEALIFCGDFCSPIPAKVMAKLFDCDIHCVFGNGDGDRFSILKFAASEAPNLKLYGEYANIKIDGVRIAITHYPFYAKALAKSNDFEAVFCGHSHISNKEILGNCLLMNPGEILGFKGEPTCGLFDTVSKKATIITL